MNDSGFAVIGTPDDFAAQLERLEKQSGGFGTFLNMAQDWASPQATLDSYSLMAREVFPAFQASADSLTASRDWAAENRPTFMGATTEAIMASFAKHQAEQEAAAPDAEA
jgi:limonene 1,2-monooxygenase